MGDYDDPVNPPGSPPLPPWQCLTHCTCCSRGGGARAEYQPVPAPVPAQAEQREKGLLMGLLTIIFLLGVVGAGVGLVHGAEWIQRVWEKGESVGDERDFVPGTCFVHAAQVTHQVVCSDGCIDGDIRVTTYTAGNASHPTIAVLTGAEIEHDEHPRPRPRGGDACPCLPPKQDKYLSRYALNVTMLVNDTGIMEAVTGGKCGVMQHSPFGVVGGNGSLSYSGALGCGTGQDIHDTEITPPRYEYSKCATLQPLRNCDGYTSEGHQEDVLAVLGTSTPCWVSRANPNWVAITKPGGYGEGEAASVAETVTAGVVLLACLGGLLALSVKALRRGGRCGGKGEGGVVPAIEAQEGDVPGQYYGALPAIPAPEEQGGGGEVQSQLGRLWRSFGGSPSTAPARLTYTSGGGEHQHLLTAGSTC